MDAKCPRVPRVIKFQYRLQHTCRFAFRTPRGLETSKIDVRLPAGDWLISARWAAQRRAHFAYPQARERPSKPTRCRVDPTGVVSKRAEVVLALSIGLLVIAIRAPLMDLPLERDEGGYAYIAWRMTLGETPYLDWFDQKPPGIFAAYRVALSLSDDAVVAIRALAAVFSAASSIALFYLVRALLGVGAGLMSALLLAFLSADPMIQGSIANTELFMLPGIVVATWLVLRAIDLEKTPIVVSHRHWRLDWDRHHIQAGRRVAHSVLPAGLRPAGARDRIAGGASPPSPPGWASESRWYGARS